MKQLSSCYRLLAANNSQVLSSLSFFSVLKLRRPKINKTRKPWSLGKITLTISGEIYSVKVSKCYRLKKPNCGQNQHTHEEVFFSLVFALAIGLMFFLRHLCCSSDPQDVWSGRVVWTEQSNAVQRVIRCILPCGPLAEAAHSREETRVLGEL